MRNLIKFQKIYKKTRNILSPNKQTTSLGAGVPFDRDGLASGKLSSAGLYLRVKGAVVDRECGLTDDL